MCGRLKRKDLIEMGRQSALMENGYEKGTKEYNYYLSQMEKLEYKLCLIRNRNLTYSRYFGTLRLLKEFEMNDLKFTIGEIDYLDLIKFLEAAYGTLSKDFIKSAIQKFTSFPEINPMSYGYKSISLVPVIKKIKEIKELIGVDKLCL